MPVTVIPEDIWMRILQISDEDAFLANRKPALHNETAVASNTRHLSDWCRGRRSPFSITRLKPVSTIFSMTCAGWRKAILATGACWLATVNNTMTGPISEVVLQKSLNYHQASDIDIYIHDLDLLMESEPDLQSSRIRAFLRLLLGYSCRWRSLMVLELEDAEITHVINCLNSVEIWSRLIALDIATVDTWYDQTPVQSLISSQFPSLICMHIDSHCISLAASAAFPSITHMSMEILGVTASDLLRSISNTSVIKSLRVVSNLSRRRNGPPVITGPVLWESRLDFPFLTNLEIQMSVDDLLPFFRRIALSSLKTLRINTASTSGNWNSVLPKALNGESVALPSLLSFEIHGEEIVESHINVISHFSMPALDSLHVQSYIVALPLTFERSDKSVPPIRLPSLQTMSLRGPLANEELIAVFDVPNLRTLILKADPRSRFYHRFTPNRTSPLILPLLRTLEIQNHGLGCIENVLRHHNFPALVSLKLPSLIPPEYSTDWHGFLEEHQSILGKLQELEMDLSEIEDGEEILAKFAPFVHVIGKNTREQLL